MVDFTSTFDRLEGVFVECLTALPNLHTLEIGSAPGGQVHHPLTAALSKRRGKLQLEQVRTLVLPPEAHLLLQYCPNVEDLTYNDTTPDEAFVQSLEAGGLNRITKLSVLYASGSEDWRREGVRLSRVYFILCSPSIT